MPCSMCMYVRLGIHVEVCYRGCVIQLARLCLPLYTRIIVGVTGICVYLFISSFLYFFYFSDESRPGLIIQHSIRCVCVHYSVNEFSVSFYLLLYALLIIQVSSAVRASSSNNGSSSWLLLLFCFFVFFCSDWDLLCKNLINICPVILIVHQVPLSTRVDTKDTIKRHISN